MKTFLHNLKCWLFGHDAAGPVEGVFFEIEPGRYHPVYQCRRCYSCLKWRVAGGWEASPK